MDEQGGFDPKRRLCPDGACTGVIGREGRCTECGRTAGGGGDKHRSDNGAGAAASQATSPHAWGADDVAASPADTATGAGASSAGAGSGTDSGFDPSRRLCDDGACVGVIPFPGGPCTVCGRVAT